MTYEQATREHRELDREVDDLYREERDRRESQAPKTPLDEIDLSTVESPTLRRLIEEVRLKIPSPFGGFDRVYNRHNR